MKTASIIIPTFNRGQIIQNSIYSVLNQNYKKLEIIVVDDGSTDNTKFIIQKIAKRNSDPNKYIRYYYQKRQGACIARNRGMMHANGSYIMFLDSDDLIKPSKIKTQVEKIESEKTQCSICDFEIIDNEGKVTKSFTNNFKPIQFILKFVSPSISAILFRRDTIPPGLSWNFRLMRNQDMDFIYKYFACIDKWSYVNTPLFQYCYHDQNRISNSYYKGVQYHELRKSFRNFIINNKSFIASDPLKLYKDYSHVLWKLQIKDKLKSYLPASVKRHLKSIQKDQRLFNKN